VNSKCIYKTFFYRNKYLKYTSKTSLILTHYHQPNLNHSFMSFTLCTSFQIDVIIVKSTHFTLFSHVLWNAMADRSMVLILFICFTFYVLWHCVNTIYKLPLPSTYLTCMIVICVVQSHSRRRPSKLSGHHL